MKLNLFYMLVTVVLFMAAGFGMRAGSMTPNTTVNTLWTHYLDANLPEQDVFMEISGAHAATPDPFFIASLLGPRTIFGPTIVRVERKDAQIPSNLDKMMYAATKIVPHDPFKLGSNPLGPYYRGDPLGFTLRQWLAARGTGTYAVSGDGAELNLEFQQLIPEGHYALWCGRTSAPPQFSESEKACGAADASQNRFRADANGNASFRLRLKALPTSTPAITTMLTLTYERDVDLTDDELGGYGQSSHVQLFYAFPIRPNTSLVCGDQIIC